MAHFSPNRLTVSVIIPIHNTGEMLRECLESIAQSETPPDECIVVDDGSTDDSLRHVQGFGAQILTLTTRRGPSHARNVGSLAARGSILLFLDSDVTVHPDTISLVLARFQAEPDLGALFGSYDDEPKASGMVSQFRNLLHCFVHRTSARRASTFWAGCGAIRRDLFLEHDGFDVGYAIPCIEDIELGGRLARAGARIALESDIQVTHLKQWNFRSMVATDIQQRGIPWTRLILDSQRLPNELNLQLGSRVSVALAMALFALTATLIGQAAGGAAGSYAGIQTALLSFALLSLIGLNFDFYRFLSRKRGGAFAIGGVFLHLIYFVCCGISFAIGLAQHYASPLTARLRTQSSAKQLTPTQ